MKTKKLSRQQENRNNRLQGMMEVEEQTLVLEVNEAEKRIKEAVLAESFEGTGNEMEEWAIRAGYYRRRLRLVRESLERLRFGDFGICESCNQEIDDKRLKAVPTATYCFDCQQERERERTGMDIGSRQ